MSSNEFIIFSVATATPNDMGGYDYSFVDMIPDRLVCKICILPSRDPYLTTCCGHVFYKSCLDNAKKVTSRSRTRSTSTACPVCCDKEFITFCNKQLDREVKGLHMMCTNKERGCEWQGELNDINNHLGNSDGCQFEDVECSNECGKMLKRQYLTSHVETECPNRKVDCQYCHITGEYLFIEGDHKEQCPRFLLPCPNNCKFSCPRSVRGRKRRAHPYSREAIRYVPREDMGAHRDECPLQEVECLHQCGKMVQRKHLTNHVEKECPHRKIKCCLCHITGEHQFIEGKHKEQCPKLPLSCPNKCEVGSVPRENMEVHRKECPLEMVQCEYHNVGCKEKIVRKDIEIHKKEKMEKHLSLTTSQLITASKHIDTLMVALHPIVPPQASNMHISPAISVAQWSLKLRGKAALAQSVNPVCPVVMHVTEFNKKRATKAIWYSDTFYSHDKGYRMCLNVFAGGNGNGTGTHLSVFLYLMKGPHDCRLRWPLRGTFKVKLLNQISDCEHYSTTIAYDDHTKNDSAGRIIDGEKAPRGWGKSQFIANGDLYKVTPTSQFVKDDCIFLRVTKL